MRYGSNALGCHLIALLLFLCSAAPVGAAERTTEPDGLPTYLAYIIGGVLAIALIGGVILWQISQRTSCTSAELPSTQRTRFTPLYKLLLEPGIIVIVFCIGMYIAYPYVAKALGAGR
jgi:hypothetical protein